MNDHFKIQLVRHEADEVEAVLQRVDRLCTHSDYADPYAEGEELNLTAYRTSSILFPWLPRATAKEDSHFTARLTSPTELNLSYWNAT